MKILIVDPDISRGTHLQLTLATHGAEVTVAPSGSFALTMLEWNRHDVIVSRARIEDMDGHELCAILKSDPATRDLRFVLVAGADEVTAVQTMAAGVDLVLAPTLSATAMVPLVFRLVEADAAPTPAPSVTPTAPPEASPFATAAPASPIPRTAATTVTPFGRPSTQIASRVAPITTSPAAAVPIAPAPALTPPAPRTPDAVAPPVVAASLAAPRAPAPEPAVPKLRPEPLATPIADPPKRYVTAAAAAAAAPWTKTAAPAGMPTAAAPAAPVMNLDAMPSGTFQGSLEVMDLAELTQAIAMGGKRGRLILALPQGGGVVAFEAGQVVHAEYCGTVGERAFAALLTAAHTEGGGRFCFLPATAAEKVSPGRTIDKSVDRLLLSIATAIDEKR